MILLLLLREAIASQEARAALDVLKLQSDDYLGPMGRLQIIYNHAAITVPALPALVEEVKMAGGFNSTDSVVAEFYMDNRFLLGSFLNVTLDQILAMSHEELAVKSSQLTDYFAEYAHDWRSLCMYRFLPSYLRAYYRKYFHAEATVITYDTPEDLAATEDRYLQLAPGVKVKSVVSFIHTRAAYNVEHLIPGEVVGMYFTFVDSVPSRYADSAQCVVSIS
jgi:hypothetical protein